MTCEDAGVVPKQQLTASPRLSFPWIWTASVAVISIGLVGVLFFVPSLSGAIPEGLAGVIGAIGWLVLPLLFTTLGAIIVTRQPGNRISWLLFIIGSAVLIAAAAAPLVVNAPTDPTFWVYLAIVLSTTMWLGIFFPIFHLLFVFPTDHFLTPRWSWAAWLKGVPVGTALILGLLISEIGPPSQEWVIANPIGFLPANFFSQGWSGIVWGLGLAAMALGAGGHDRPLPAFLVHHPDPDQVGSLCSCALHWRLYGRARPAVLD